MDTELYKDLIDSNERVFNKLITDAQVEFFEMKGQIGRDTMAAIEHVFMSGGHKSDAIELHNVELEGVSEMKEYLRKKILKLIVVRGWKEDDIMEFIKRRDGRI